MYKVYTFKLLQSCLSLFIIVEKATDLQIHMHNQNKHGIYNEIYMHQNNIIDELTYNIKNNITENGHNIALYYNNFVSSSNVKAVFNMDAQHCMVTYVYRMLGKQCYILHMTSTPPKKDQIEIFSLLDVGRLSSIVVLDS